MARSAEFDHSSPRVASRREAPRGRGAAVDLLVMVQERGRLHGPNEARAAVRAVLGTLCDVLPPPLFQPLAVHLPAPLRIGLPYSGVPVASCHDFVTRIGDRLL